MLDRTLQVIVGHFLPLVGWQ